MTPTERTSNMRSLDRAIDVLEALEQTPKGLRLSDIAQQTGLPVPTTLRILNALVARGRVDHDGTYYRAGVNLLFGAHAYLTSSPLVQASRAVLQDLVLATGLAASVFVRSRNDRVVIARVEGSNPLRYELPIGERLPLHLGAGKVLIAHLPPEVRDAMVAEFCPFTTAGGRVFTADVYRDELDVILRTGYALSESERVLNGRSLAVPVIGTGGAVAAALQVAGTVESLPTTQVLTVTHALQEQARALGARI